MKHLKKTNTAQAKTLMVDDHFKIGGVMYRISEITTNVLDLTIITAYPIKKNTNDIIELTVRAKTLITFYNQKQ